METGRVDTGQATGHREPWVELEHGLGWNDLVLGRREREQLRTIAAKVRMRGEAARAGGVRPGLTALFVGESGTGKTMAAQILGGNVTRPVLQVDVPAALSGAADDAREVIDRVFAAAAREQAIIVFDGAGPFAGEGVRPTIATSELLKRARKHPGLVIFTWIATGSGDLWPRDQIDFVVELPFPAARSRSEIWRRELSADARLSEGDIRHLARSFRLTGGAIRRCCVEAIGLASAEGVPVGLHHLAPALERECGGEGSTEHMRLALAQLRGTEKPSAGASAAEFDAAASPRTRRTRGDQQRHDGSIWARGRTGRIDRPAWLGLPRRREASTHVGRGWLILGAVATVAAGAVGFAVGHGGGGSSPVAALDKQALAGPVTVSYPSKWRRQPVAIGGAPRLGDQLVLASEPPPSGALVIGSARTTDARLLPGDLLSELSSVPPAQLVTLGATKFYRYRGLTPRGADHPESVYATPTTAGTIVAVCAPRGAGPGFTGECERVLATLRVVSGTLLTPGPSAAYGSALDRVIARLGAVRAAADSRLRAAHAPGAVEQAATELASAHREAAAGVLGLEAGQAGAANSALANAFQMIARAYAALGSAIAHRSSSGYREASLALTRASSAVSSAYAQLSRLGYRVG